MKYNIFGYLIGEGFSNVFKNKKSTGASLMIMCATMIIFGIFLILGENINHFVDQVKSEQGFQVFLKTDATDEEVQKVGEEIRKIDGVSTAEYKDKAYVLSLYSAVLTPFISLISSPTFCISSSVASVFKNT